MTFRPTCPRCGNVCEPEATICMCGSRTGITPRARVTRPFDADAARAASLVPAMPADSRFVVTEVEGFLGDKTAHSRRPLGLSCHVLDRAVCYRTVATFRTEDDPCANTNRGATGYLTPWERRERVRGLARARAMELNAGAS